MGNYYLKLISRFGNVFEELEFKSYGEALGMVTGGQPISEWEIWFGNEKMASGMGFKEHK